MDLTSWPASNDDDCLLLHTIISEIRLDLVTQESEECTVAT